MKVELIIPIERLRGKLKQDGYYFRQYRGQQIVQRCPTKWKDTPARKAAREKFAARYAGSHRQVNNPKQDPDAGLESGSEHRSTRLLPFELPSQGNSPWRNCQERGSAALMYRAADETSNPHQMRG